MKKVVKKWGQGLGVYFDQEDIKIYDIKKGDVLDLELTVEKRKGGNK